MKTPVKYVTAGEICIHSKICSVCLQNVRFQIQILCIKRVHVGVFTFARGFGGRRLGH